MQLTRPSDKEDRGSLHDGVHAVRTHVTVLDMVRRIIELMRATMEPDVRNEAVHEIRHQYLSAAKAREMLGWGPLFTLDEGLKRTVAWYERFLSAA